MRCCRRFTARSPDGEKRYSPAECIGIQEPVIEGNPDPAHISTSYVERQALPLGKQSADGSIKADTSLVKHVTRIIPKIYASAGAEIEISVGYQNEIDGAVTWKHVGTFDCDNDWKHDCRVSGRLIAIRFRSTTNISWYLSGYSVEWHYAGDR